MTDNEEGTFSPTFGIRESASGGIEFDPIDNDSDRPPALPPKDNLYAFALSLYKPPVSASSSSSKKQQRKRRKIDDTQQVRCWDCKSLSSVGLAHDLPSSSSSSGADDVLIPHLLLLQGSSCAPFKSAGTITGRPTFKMPRKPPPPALQLGVGVNHRQGTRLQKAHEEETALRVEQDELARAQKEGSQRYRQRAATPDADGNLHPTPNATLTAGESSGEEMDKPVRRTRFRKTSIRNNNYPPSALKNLQIHVSKKPGSPFVPASSSSSNLEHKRSGSLRRVPVPLVADEDEQVEDAPQKAPSTSKGLSPESSSAGATSGTPKTNLLLCHHCRSPIAVMTYDVTDGQEFVFQEDEDASDAESFWFTDDGSTSLGHHGGGGAKPITIQTKEIQSSASSMHPSPYSHYGGATDATSLPTSACSSSTSLNDIKPSSSSFSQPRKFSTATFDSSMRRTSESIVNDEAHQPDSPEILNFDVLGQFSRDTNVDGGFRRISIRACSPLTDEKIDAVSRASNSSISIPASISFHNAEPFLDMRTSFKSFEKEFDPKMLAMTTFTVSRPGSKTESKLLTPTTFSQPLLQLQQDLEQPADSSNRLSRSSSQQQLTSSAHRTHVAVPAIQPVRRATEPLVTLATLEDSASDHQQAQLLNEMRSHDVQHDKEQTAQMPQAISLRDKDLPPLPPKAPPARSAHVRTSRFSRTPGFRPASSRDSVTEILKVPDVQAPPTVECSSSTRSRSDGNTVPPPAPSTLSSRASEEELRAFPMRGRGGSDPVAGLKGDLHPFPSVAAQSYCMRTPSGRLRAATFDQNYVPVANQLLEQPGHARRDEPHRSDSVSRAPAPEDRNSQSIWRAPTWQARPRTPRLRSVRRAVSRRVTKRRPGTPSQGAHFEPLSPVSPVVQTQMRPRKGSFSSITENLESFLAPFRRAVTVRAKSRQGHVRPSPTRARCKPVVAPAPAGPGDSGTQQAGSDAEEDWADVNPSQAARKIHPRYNDKLLPPLPKSPDDLRASLIPFAYLASNMKSPQRSPQRLGSPTAARAAVVRSKRVRQAYEPGRLAKKAGVTLEIHVPLVEA